MVADEKRSSILLDREDRFLKDGCQFLTFTLGEENYGVEILRVQEIKGYTSVTRIPNTPEYIKGVLNLRGTIVPVVDLRTKFGMPKIEYSKFTVIVVLRVHSRIVGIIVDSVSDVFNIQDKDIQPPPEFGTSFDLSFIRGLGKHGDNLVALLDMDRVLSEIEEVSLLKAKGG